MTRVLREWRVIRDLSEVLCGRITNRVVRSLEGLKDAPHSGNDSGLENAWDEICVQAQGEESVLCDAYEATIDQFILARVLQLADFEREAIWLQTKAGEEWVEDVGNDHTENPAIIDEIVEHIRTEYVLAKAADWTNKRIRLYLSS